MRIWPLLPFTVLTVNEPVAMTISSVEPRPPYWPFGPTAMTLARSWKPFGRPMNRRAEEERMFSVWLVAN